MRRSRVKMEMKCFRFFDLNETIGSRKVILNDLSPVAVFIAYNRNREANVYELREEIDQWLNEAQRNVGWVYETNSTPACRKRRSVTRSGANL